LVPKAYYRAAQIFSERIKNLEQAKKILKELLQKFPDHEISSFAKAYLSRL
jgi:TolA-binding protein